MLAKIKERNRQVGRTLLQKFVTWSVLFLFVLTMHATLLWPVVHVDAATSNGTTTKQKKSEDKALLVNQSNRFLVLPPGRAATVWFEFSNVGTSSWTNADPNPVGLNTDDPFRRKSKFEFTVTKRNSRKKVPGTWRAFWRPARVQRKEVKPQSAGRFVFAVRAPKKPGIWRERFVLTRGTTQKIPGGEAEFVIVVGTQGTPDMVYKAKPKVPTISLWVKPGERVYRPVEFSNVGYATWKSRGYGETSLVLIPRIESSATSASAFSANATPAITKDAARARSTTAILDVTAPSAPGTYEESFGLSGPFGVITGSEVKIQLTVSEESPPPFSTEPIIRVGIYAPTKPVEVTANGLYETRNARTGEMISTEAADAVSTVTYDSETAEYDLVTSTMVVTLGDPVRVVPLSEDTIMQVKSYHNRREVTIDGQKVVVDDNRFRGTIEVRYASATKKVWVVNELPIERYLWGLAETTNRAPLEFVKTLVTAARSYALYHSLRGTKHANENYHVNSTTDQLYRGYNYEQRNLNIAEGTSATRGLVITHSSMVNEKNTIGAIVAAYSSCTDGRTRSFEERWGGDPGMFPYLISVPDPNGICTNQRWLQGLDGNHMVGMSATGALRTIVNDNVTYDAILKYYYAGVTVVRAYL